MRSPFLAGLRLRTPTMMGDVDHIYLFIYYNIVHVVVVQA